MSCLAVQPTLIEINPEFQMLSHIESWQGSHAKARNLNCGILREGDCGVWVEDVIRIVTSNLSEAID
jgi:hypothetical protein